MCGIAGYLNLRASEPPSEALLRRMLAMIRHRGPDQFGIYLDDHVGLGNARLSIVDLGGGQQPIADTAAPEYSHLIRWRNSRRTQRFFSAHLAEQIKTAARPLLDSVPLPAGFSSWGTLDRAQFVEISTFLSTYLLSSQGDRVGMGNSIEGRFPFLDVRVMEFAMRLPARLRMRALRDKRLLRQLGAELLPDDIWNRPKKPYRAPIHRSFFHQRTPAYVRELLSERALAESGLFNPAAVAKLVAKITNDQPVGETDDMALAGILSTQLLHHFCTTGFRAAAPLSDRDDVKVCDRRTATAVA